jgi:hypothetical protein
MVSTNRTNTSEIIGKSKVVPRSRVDEKYSRPVDLPPLVPPLLSGAADIYGLVVFLEKYEQYVNRGGQIPLRQCIASAILEDMQVFQNASISTQANLQKALMQYYCPEDKSKALSILKNVKCPQCESMTSFNKQRYKQYVRTFLTIMGICAHMCPPLKECLKVLVKNTQPPELSSYLRTGGLEDTSYSTVRQMLSEAVDKFFAAHKIVQANRVSSKPRSAYGTSGAPNARRPPSDINPNQVKRWPREMCLGCGHVTNPPHRRRDCPYRHCEGWQANGVPSAPISIPPVALCTH